MKETPRRGEGFPATPGLLLRCSRCRIACLQLVARLELVPGLQLVAGLRPRLHLLLDMTLRLRGLRVAEAGARSGTEAAAHATGATSASASSASAAAATTAATATTTTATATATATCQRAAGSDQCGNHQNKNLREFHFVLLSMPGY